MQRRGLLQELRKAWDWTCSGCSLNGESSQPCKPVTSLRRKNPRTVARWLIILCGATIIPVVLILLRICLSIAADDTKARQAGSFRIKPGVHLEYETLVIGSTTLEKIQGKAHDLWQDRVDRDVRRVPHRIAFSSELTTVRTVLTNYWAGQGGFVLMAKDIPDVTIGVSTNSYTPQGFSRYIESVLASNSIIILHDGIDRVKAVPASAVELVPH